MDNEGLLRYNQFVGLSQESLMDEENESMQNLHMSFQETPDARVSFTNAFQVRNKFSSILEYDLCTS